MKKLVAAAAFAALLGFGLSSPAQAGSDHRKAFNEALDQCEEKHGDQRQDCYNSAMETYRMAVEKAK